MKQKYNELYLKNVAPMKDDCYIKTQYSVVDNRFIINI